MYKCPREYLLSAHSEGQVRAMGYYLFKYFSRADTKGIRAELEYLKEAYAKDTAEAFAQQQKMEQSLRLIINSLENKVSVILNEIRENDSNVFECTLARKFVSQYQCAYNIEKLLPKQVKGKMKQERSQYVITFPASLKKGKKPKKEVRLSTLSEYSFNLTHRFLDEYSQFLDATNTISLGEDLYNACGIFCAYFEKLKTVLFNEYLLTKGLSAKEKEGVFSFVYDYAMISVYSKIFPQEPTASDKKLSLKFHKLSKLTPEQLKVKPENFHPELIGLIIKGPFHSH
eukprot:TRINITY_DN6365_c0_g1_i1.p1 TRINITY_DN6365_c0_g1~~TRINITY_DN6365_c0_g1_i1.p1  ORF type:complete len:286 (-),score=37.06 TRINITY_DN6365_c0_g1_i1:357-1214(-)